MQTNRPNRPLRGSSTELVPTGYAEGRDLHGRGHNQWRLGGVADGVLVVHETTGHDGLVLQDDLVAVTAFQAFLVLVALVLAVLHLQEVPHHAVLPHCGHKVPLLLPILRHLGMDIIAGYSRCTRHSKLSPAYIQVHIILIVLKQLKQNAPLNCIQMIQGCITSTY